MASTNKQQQLKIKQLLEDLNSGNANKFSAALKSLQIHGDCTTLEPIVSLIDTGLNEKQKQEIVQFLSDLRDTSCIQTMIDILRNDTYRKARPEILTSIWNSKLDYSYFLPDFVEIAVDGSFMEALECLTVIENMEGPFEERHILESQLHLKDYMEDSDPKDPQKAQIMSEIALILKDYDLEIDDY